MTEAEIKIEYGGEFRRCLIEMDVSGMQRLWGYVAPHLTSNKSSTIYSMHLARTEMKTLPSKLKLYSQRWLNERHLGSFMQEDRRGR